MSTSKANIDWIEDGEKFALIGLRVHTDPDFGRLDLTGGLTILAKTAFKVPDDFWREWLGTARVEDIEECDLFLVATSSSKSPGVLDAENQLLLRRVGNLFMALNLVSKFTAAAKPSRATGTRIAGGIDVRQFAELDRPVGSIVSDYNPIGEAQLQDAREISTNLQSFDGPWRLDHWRFFRCYGIYHTTRTNLDMLDRIHQFTRCIEGLIAAKQGETKRQFKSRTELFIGPSHHALMGELYEVRCDIEHLHEHKLLSARDRPTRIRLAQLEAVSEWVARSCIAHVLRDPSLLRHFGNADALQKFWARPAAERRAIWGPPVDPYSPLNRFKFEYVGDGELGADSYA